MKERTAEAMNIAVVGLGLIGGSLCKALKQKTGHRVLGVELDRAVCRQAEACGCVDAIIGADELAQAGLTIVCLHPKATRAFILKRKAVFAKGSIVTDVCGVKGQMAQELTDALLEQGVFYVGAHPMAGKERFGFANSDGSLFAGANFIVTPCRGTQPQALQAVKELALSVGAGRIIEIPPMDHDRIIAYTSQLAHVVSSAYVKSGTIEEESGFSGGSFQDMTRIATLNEEMWASLFLLNRDCLLAELDTLLHNLTEYRDALARQDGEGLTRLLRDGRLAKERNLQNGETQ